MSFEAGIQANSRLGVSRFGASAADARSPRFRHPLDVIGRAYEPGPAAEQSAAGRLFAPAVMVVQLALPVTLLLALGVVGFLYGDVRVLWLGEANSEWLTLGHLMLPLSFFAIHLTNRRYGAGYAFAQIVLAWGLGTAALWGLRPELGQLGGRPLPEVHLLAAFGTALFFAQIFSVLVFDGTRGPRWWTAPFFASLSGGIVFCLIGFPFAYVGTEIDWFARLLTFAGIMAISALVLLVPYAFLRRMVPPLPGFGGY